MMRWHSAGMLLLSSAAAAAGPRVHTVFCAECTNNFDYKSIGAFWSHNISGMPGGITRLLACDENQMKTYRGMSIGPTFVHINHGHMRQQRELLPGETKHPHGSRQTDSSPSYNKPGSIMHWIQESEEAKHVDYVLYIDADMLIRRPMDPIALGVKPGVVVSEHVGYLDVGIKNGLPAMFLPPEFVEYAGADVHVHTTPPPEGLRVSAGGWYHFFHVDDIRAIAHRWLHYCKEMRLNPQKYWKIIDPDTGLPSGTDHDILTGDAYVGRNQAPWISEMYGYVFAAAERKLKHILTEGVVVYPDEIGAGRREEASIIHYGLHCAVGAFRFTKYTFGNFDAVGCTGKTFGEPPAPTHMERLCAETVLTLNDAMCDYYAKPTNDGGCGLGEAAGWHTCPKWKPVDGSRGNACEDSDKASCATWSHAGECKANPGFMLGSCPKSCGQCEKMAQQSIPAWERGLALAKGLPAPPLRQRTQEMVSYSDKHSLHPNNAGGGAGVNAGAGASGLGAATPAVDDEATQHADEATRRAEALEARAEVEAGTPALTDNGAQTAGSVAYHGPSNEHHDSAHAMGPDGRAIDSDSAGGAAGLKSAAQGARLRAAKVAGEAIAAKTPKPPKKRSLKAALATAEKVAGLPGADGGAGGAGGAGGEATTTSKGAAARTEVERAVARADAADDAREASVPTPTAGAAAATATPVESLTSRMIVMWAAVLLGCVLMLAKRFGLLPCFRRPKRGGGGKAGGRDF